MPFYDLRCNTCTKEHNISASIREKTEKQVPCPTCGSLDLETIFLRPPAQGKARLSSPRTQCANAPTCGSVCRHAG